jgi:methylmalonyl-CoA/ethylmalonyl-CoA epimerase
LKSTAVFSKKAAFNSNQVQKIDHIGIAVKNLEISNLVFKKLLGVAPYKSETIENQGVNTSFFEVGDTKIELLEAIDSSSILACFLEKRGEGIHHIAFSVDDIYLEIKRLQSEGFVVINEKPQLGADNKWFVFLHPKEIHGVLIELCQENT